MLPLDSSPPRRLKESEALGTKSANMAATVWSSVFITGCNRGIGLELVKQFLQLPAAPKHLFATCRSLASESAEELKCLAKVSPNLKLLELDVSDSEAIKRVYSQVEEELRDEGLSLLINNAGVLTRSRFEEITAQEMIETFKTNTLAPLMIAQMFLPLLRRAVARKTGENSGNVTIVNVSSRAGCLANKAVPGFPVAYRASKAALNMVSRSLSVDLAEDGIICVAVSPGWVRTKMGVESKELPCFAQTSVTLLSPEESVKGLIEVMNSLDQSKSGGFYDTAGKVIPW